MNCIAELCITSEDTILYMSACHLSSNTYRVVGFGALNIGIMVEQFANVFVPLHLHFERGRSSEIDYLLCSSVLYKVRFSMFTLIYGMYMYLLCININYSHYSFDS